MVYVLDVVVYPRDRLENSAMKEGCRQEHQQNIW